MFVKYTCRASCLASISYSRADFQFLKNATTTSGGVQSIETIIVFLLLLLFFFYIYIHDSATSSPLFFCSSPSPSPPLFRFLLHFPVSFFSVHSARSKKNGNHFDSGRGSCFQIISQVVVSKLSPFLYNSQLNPIYREKGQNVPRANQLAPKIAIFQYIDFRRTSHICIIQIRVL